MRSSLLAFLVASGASLPALAGPVSQAARGVENKQESREESSPSRAPQHDSGRDEDRDDDDDGCSSCGVAVQASDFDTSGSVTDDGTGGGGGIVLEGPARFDAYLGAHAVVDSDGAAALDLRLRRDFVGLSMSGTSYFEEVEDKGRMDSVRLDMWALGLAGRLARAGDSTELWIEGGFAVSTSTEYDAIAGLQTALRAEHRIRPELELFGRVRYYGMQDDVSAFEAWGGVRAWVIAAGYRSLQFNVGPPIHGPEAGISLQF